MVKMILAILGFLVLAGGTFLYMQSIDSAPVLINTGDDIHTEEEKDLPSIPVQEKTNIVSEVIEKKKKIDIDIATITLKKDEVVEPVQTITRIVLPRDVIESTIYGEYNGWNGDTIYKLTNGQFWEQSSYYYEYDYEYMPDVLIYPSGSGYKMKVGDGGESVGVQQVFDVIESQIDGDYEGWEGETVYSLYNGQVWQQSSYHYHYHYAYSPSVMIFKSQGGGYKMKVEGDDGDAVDVWRIR